MAEQVAAINIPKKEASSILLYYFIGYFNWNVICKMILILHVM